jgi:hypothetical protein
MNTGIIFHKIHRKHFFPERSDILDIIILHNFLMLIICSFIGPSGFAHANNIPPAGVQKSIQGNEIRGVVDSVVLGDPANETRPKLSIIAVDGRKHTFVIRPTTTIYDRAWKPVTLDKIHKGQYVRIRYRINREGYTIAISIKPSGMMRPSLPAP